MGRRREHPKKESVKLSGRFSKYTAVTMFLNYNYCCRSAIPVKRVRSPRHRDNNNRARLWIANPARPSAALERTLDDEEDNEKDDDEDSRRDARRTFASPT